jgi:putative ABC transport system substrate-binding protein
MRRRDFLVIFGSAAAAWPLPARGQHAVPLIGFLGGADPIGYKSQMDALLLGLRDYGYVEGNTIAIEYRWAEGRYDRLPALAAELVTRKVAVIITQGTPAAFAAKRATSTIPIVMAIVGNPVDTKIVRSLSRPDGNITGSSFFWAEVSSKRLELLKELMPTLSRVGVLVNPDNPAMESLLRAVTQTANAIGVAVQPVHLRRADDLKEVIERIRPQIEALIVVDDGLFVANAQRIAEISNATRLPSIGFREYAEAGGLAAYGVDFPHIWRRAGAFVDKILKGREPQDLPIEQATHFEIVINLKSAKSLGFPVPPSFSARANQVLE